jgi:hypothetical protein
MPSAIWYENPAWYALALSIVSLIVSAAGFANCKE